MLREGSLGPRRTLVVLRAEPDPKSASSQACQKQRTKEEQGQSSPTTKGETEAQREVDTCLKSHCWQKQCEQQNLSPLTNDLIIRSNHSSLLASSAHPKMGCQDDPSESGKSTRLWMVVAVPYRKQPTESRDGSPRETRG